MSFENVYLARQPIVSGNLDLYGYELLFRSTDHGTTADVDDDLFATSAVINNAFTEIGIDQVTGENWAFINVDEQFLLGDLVEALPKERVVLEILDRTQINDELIERCLQLRKLGYRLALDDVFSTHARLSDLLQIVDVVKIDVSLLEPDALGSLVKRIRAFKVQLVAEKVDTPERFKVCRDHGFDYFQGFHFARPQLLVSKRANPAKLALLRLLSLAMHDAETQEIEAELKRYPMLSVNLLRLVNSVGIGARQPINSIRHALVMLGRKQLQSWLQLLMYTADRNNRALSSPFLQLAATRGKLMEQLAERQASYGREHKDQAFITGIMSLMDALLEMSFEEICKQLSLPPAVSSALLHREGPLGELLTVTEKLEQDDHADLGRLHEDYPTIPLAELPEMLINAYSWANALSATSA